MKLFSITDIYNGRRCHWYVAWRKQKDANIPAEAQEFFTEREARTFVKFAREHLQTQVTVTPMTALPPKSFEEQIIEAGWKLYMIDVDLGAGVNFAVGCFEEGLRNTEGLKEKAAIEDALKDMERMGLVKSRRETRPVEYEVFSARKPQQPRE